MEEIQLIYLILKYGNLEILYKNELKPDYFVIHKDIIDFILDFNNDYASVPTFETVSSNFPETEWAEEEENQTYLATQIKESYVFNSAVTIINEHEQDLKDNSFSGVSKIQKMLVDLLAITGAKYGSLTNRQEEEAEKYDKIVSTGFKLLDGELGGFRETNELVTIMGRPGTGKSWFGLKLLVELWKSGLRVGLYSGEMDEKQLWYRFDTLNLNLSNTLLSKGYYEKDESYIEYREKLRSGNDIPILTYDEQKRKANINDLESMIITHDLQVLVVDQLSLLDDVRKQRGDNKRQSYDNLSMDLFNLAGKYQMIIILLVQVNREGKKAESLNLEHIAESDNVGQNSSKVIGLIPDENGVLRVLPIKNRTGKKGKEVLMVWDIDNGIYEERESEAVEELEGAESVFIP